MTIGSDETGAGLSQDASGAGPAPLPTHEREIAFGRLHAPVGVASCPGIVLIHDVWGRSEHSRALSAKVAGRGFAVVELDLYRALPEPRVTDPGERIRSLDDGHVLADLDAAADWLAAQPVCRGRRIGVMGVCMGGTYSLLAACGSTRFAAAAPFYGVLSYDRDMYLGPEGRDRRRKPASPIERAESLRMPVLAAFGCDDGFVPLADVDRLEAGFARSGTAWRVDRYTGAGHAFLNETRPEAYRPELAATALARAVEFLHARLD
ncbi:MAG: dienelactone hydrolase family protein [Myxococcota bacterium]